jgi:hypothetical protein
VRLFVLAILLHVQVLESPLKGLRGDSTAFRLSVLRCHTEI